MKKRKDLYRKVRNNRVKEKIVTMQMGLAYAHEVRLRLMCDSKDGYISPRDWHNALKK